MHMGIWSGGSNEALDEQWEAQQEIISARRGEDAQHAKKRKIESPKIEMKLAEKVTKLNVDVEDSKHHHKSTPKFFWDLGK
eukprot:CAMPEP_0172302432 /NCGR_PEP_ID=MMETSP1058-20130122/4132_1 /TAXON_ID=83371 /ORGANISM="Detonula confervacea, Strain CCMP 353" /LENGTH=80 /DNA_ID=CAMNT_0013012901 /DNA_START=258 /DNA_END=500 /DNA_ORIENTATION=+